MRGESDHDYGVGESKLSQAMRFAIWCRNQRTPMPHQRVMRYFNVSRATAYRWIQAFRIVDPDHARRVFPDGGVDDPDIDDSAPYECNTKKDVNPPY